MRWLTHRRAEEPEKQMPKAGAIEIVAHQAATKEALKEVHAANQQLKKLFEENGFTLKIYLAAGGKHRTPKQRN